MPELPDIEVWKSYVDATALHRKIKQVVLFDPALVKGNSSTIKNNLEGCRLQETRRHGKYLLIHTNEDDWLTLHFGMTGALSFQKKDGKVPRYTALEIDFSDKSKLFYLNKRRLGHIEWTYDYGDFISSHNQGRDALAIEPEEIGELLRQNGSRVTKNILMDQSVIAGIGNIYSDEILYQSHIRPHRKVSSLDAKELGRLSRQIHRVLKMAIERDADPKKYPRTWLTRHRQPRGVCPRCHHLLHHDTVNSRTSYWCKQCQN